MYVSVCAHPCLYLCIIFLTPMGFVLCVCVCVHACVHACMCRLYLELCVCVLVCTSVSVSLYIPDTDEVYVGGMMCDCW